MILRFCICIPTFDNPATIQAVIDDCLARTLYPILVIDDGSSRPIALARPDERVSILRFETNQGKGAALQAGFQECVRRGFTHMISIDGDGQHLASEIAGLVTVSLQSPWDIVIGSRRFQSENVPEISKFGRKFSNFWVRFQSDRQVTDSQSGFRIYPLFHVQNMKFWTRKFDFEIEVLIRLLWRGVSVREVEIDCHYPAAHERVSHFHKFWDNLRISCLNTVLVALSLLRREASPREIGWAVGTGVLIGCTPLFGFHTLIVAGLAFAFRWNAAFLWLGSQISIPPLAPFLALASIALGSKLAGPPSRGALGFSWNWLLGSLGVGAILGLVLGTLAFVAALSLQKRRKNAKKGNWNGRTRGGRFGNGFLKLVTRHAGLKSAYGFLFFIVPYFYLFAPKARRASNEYWKIIRPEEGLALRQWRVLNHFFRFAQTLLDRIYQSCKEKPCFETREQGMENILKPLREGKGLILMTAHTGGWDIAAAGLKDAGIGRQFHMVQYESQGITFDKATQQKNPPHISKLITNQVKQPLLHVRELLALNLPVGLMGDRPLGNQFELITFFGKLAPVDCTAFRVAVACQVPLLFTFGFKAGTRTYDFYANPARLYSYPVTMDRSLAVLEWAQDFALALESGLRKYPDQWFNFFPYWSSLPAPPADIAAAKARNYSKEELHRPRPAAPESAAAPRPSDESEFRA